MAASDFTTNTSQNSSVWPKSAHKCCLFDEFGAFIAVGDTRCICNLTRLLIRKFHEVSLGCLPCFYAVGQYLEDTMKKLVLAAALTGAATFASAGNMEEPMMEAPVVVEETTASSSAAGVWVPLVLLAIVAAVVAAD